MNASSTSATTFLPERKDITLLLNQAWYSPEDETRLINVIYGEIYKLAKYAVRKEKNSLATEFSNEFCIRFAQRAKFFRWENRTQFKNSIASFFDRRKKDIAKSQNRLKRGGVSKHVSENTKGILSYAQNPALPKRAAKHVPMDSAEALRHSCITPSPDTIVAGNECVERALTKVCFDRVQRQIVEMLIRRESRQAIVEQTGLSPSAVKRRIDQLLQRLNDRLKS